MKKALSILLSVMMVAGLFIALVPTASAAVVAADMPELDMENPVYFNDFDSIDSSLEGEELLTELGWYLSSDKDENMDGYGDTYYDYSNMTTTGEGIAVTEDYGSGAITLIHSGSAPTGSNSGWENLVIVGDEKLAGGDYVIEFDIAFESTNITAEVEEGNLYRGATVGTGASCGFVSTGHYGSNTHKTMRWHYGIKSRGERDIHIAYPLTKNASLGVSDIDYTPADYSDTTMYSITAGAGAMMKFRVVVSATQGISAWLSEDEGYSWTQTDSMTEDQITTWQTYAHMIAKEVRWRATGGMDATIDNLGIYLFADKDVSGATATGTSTHYVPTTTPELVISEVVTQATATDAQNFDVLWTPEEGSDIPTALGGAGHYYAVDEFGNYLVPEEGQGDGVTESTRFEYLEIYNSGDKTVDLTNYSIASWTSTSTGFAEQSSGGVARIHKGLKVITDTADGLTWQYYNAPEDCILKPGESAILFMPNDSFVLNGTEAKRNGTVNGFKEYVLKAEYGMTDAQIDKLKIITLYDSLDELYGIFGADNYTIGNGLGINGSGNQIKVIVRNNADGSLPYDYTAGKCSFEAVKNNIVSYVADSAGVDGSKWIWYTLGYSEADARDGFAPKGGHGSQYTYWDAEGNFIPGGKLDKTRLPSANDAANRTVGYVPADLMNPNVDLTAAPKNEAQWLGFQTTVAESGKYDLRLVATIADMTGVTGIGFAISVNGGAEKVVYLEYYYTTITADYGATQVTLPEGELFGALEISGCPEATEFTVKVVTVYGDTTVTGGAYAVTYAA